MITALDLRNRGLKAIDESLMEAEEGIISYKGKPKYVVLPIERYDELLAARLDLAYDEVMENVAKGRYESAKTHEEVEAHIEMLKKAGH